MRDLIVIYLAESLNNDFTISTSKSMSRANVHRALQLPEIVEQILEDLSDDKASLANSARTSRFFSRLALAILWRHLDQPQALREIIPHDSAAEPGAVSYLLVN
jgi:hypothetical protein